MASMIEDKEHVRKLLIAELQENLHILIDPKNKDSLSNGRIQTWTNTVIERIMYHLFNGSEITKNDN